MTMADTAKGGAKAPKRKGAKKAAKKAVEGAPKGTEGPMPMADTAKDGAKAPKRKGAKKAAKKAVEGAPKGETVQNQPQAADTKPGSKASTDPKKSEEPKRVYTPEDDARTVMVFGCSPTVTKEAVRARWPSAEVVHFLMRSNRHTGTVSVLFTTTADALAAAKDGTVEIAGEKLRVAMHETPEQKAKRLEQRQRSVSVSSLPSGVTEADVLQAFPGAEAVILHKNKQKGGCALFLCRERGNASTGTSVYSRFRGTLTCCQGHELHRGESAVENSRTQRETASRGAARFGD